MEKRIILFSIIVLISFPSFAQFSFRVFPTGVSGDAYADTLLNTRAILLQAGIKVVNAYQTLPEVTKTFASKTVHLNRDGNIDKLTICFVKNKMSTTTHCVEDTFLYNTAGRVVNMKTKDNRGNNYPVWIIKHVSDSELLYSSLHNALFLCKIDVGFSKNVTPLIIISQFVRVVIYPPLKISFSPNHYKCCEP